MEINDMLKVMVDRDAADLHIRVGKPPTIRIHGGFDYLTEEVLSPDETERLMKEITPPRFQQQLQEDGSCDFAYAFSDKARFRTNVFKGQGNVGIVMRLIPTRIFSFEQLGLPFDAVSPFLNAHRGLVIVTGPTGSGKTTSLATMLDWINTNRAVHMITVEDPIEYTHKHKKAIVTHREVHIDTPSFSYALRGALRQDPDVILVGEMRDLETMEAATTAAETGHLVFATLHTMGASSTVDRIIDAFPANQQEQMRAVLSVALEAILSQTLCPKIGGGRVAAYELMLAIAAIRNLIRTHKTNRIDSVIQTSGKLGMFSLDDYLYKLFREELIVAEEAINRSTDWKLMEQRILGTMEEEEEAEGDEEAEEGAEAELEF